MGIKNNDFETLHAEICSNLTLWKTKSSQDENILQQFRDEAINIQELVTRTLTLGESNSLLIVGPRGCGKTSIINAITNKLRSNKVLDLGMVVTLTGLLQTDDRLALQEITRQLNVDGEDACRFGSFAENLNFILKTLQSGKRDESKPIIFILDEFDLFCHHRNQTLLYNLFDIAQSAQAPICVIGLTARLDVIELLEKRVKSRFSHRQIFLFPNEKFENYVEIARNLLKVDKSTSCSKDSVTAWNANVEKLLKCSEVLEILKKRFCLSKDGRTLKSFLVLALARLDPESPFLSAEVLREAAEHLSQDSKGKMLEGLSVLQLSLLIAMKHLSLIYDGEPFNFEMVYRQYNKFGERHSSMSSYERPVVFKAFDQLECLELIQPVEQSRSLLQREYRLMQLLVVPQQIEKAIQTMPNLPTFLSHWCTSNVL